MLLFYEKSRVELTRRSQRLHRDGRQTLLLLPGDLWPCGCCPPVGDVEKEVEIFLLDATSPTEIRRKKVGLLLLPEPAWSGNPRSRCLLRAGGLGQSLPGQKEMCSSFFFIYINIYIYMKVNF